MKQRKEVRYEVIFDPANPSHKQYKLLTAIRWYSERYGKWVDIPEGRISDGATGGIDIASESWWVHDEVCRTGVWSDGTPCTDVQKAILVGDVLAEEGRYVRRVTWPIATYFARNVIEWYNAIKKRVVSGR